MRAIRITALTHERMNVLCSNVNATLEIEKMECSKLEKQRCCVCIRCEHAMDTFWEHCVFLLMVRTKGDEINVDRCWCQN